MIIAGIMYLLAIYVFFCYNSYSYDDYINRLNFIWMACIIAITALLLIGLYMMFLKNNPIVFHAGIGICLTYLVATTFFIPYFMPYFIRYNESVIYNDILDYESIYIVLSISVILGIMYLVGQFALKNTPERIPTDRKHLIGVILFSIISVAVDFFSYGFSYFYSNSSDFVLIESNLYIAPIFSVGTILILSIYLLCAFRQKISPAGTYTCIGLCVALTIIASALQCFMFVGDIARFCTTLIVTLLILGAYLFYAITTDRKATAQRSGSGQTFNDMMRQLQELQKLHENGILTDEEMAREKEKILSKL